MFIIARSTSRAARSCRGMGVDGRAAAARRDGARAHGLRAERAPKVRLAAIEMVHGSAGSTKFGIEKNMWSPAAGRPQLRPDAEQPQPARAVPRSHHHRQQHRRAQRRGVRGAGNRRRSLPFERGVPDPDAPASDAGLGRSRRHVARPALRAEVRAGHGDSRRCSCASRTSIRPAAAPTAIRASTPTRSAGPRRTSRCRWCATRARCSTCCSASARRRRSAPSAAPRTAASSTGSSRT